MAARLSLPPWLRVAGLLLALGLAGPVAVRGGGSEASKVGAEKYGDDRIRAFTLAIIDRLDRDRVNVALIARSGRPRAKMPAGILYTHVGIAVFEPLRSPDGTVFHGYAVYNLYQGAGGRPDRSYLKQDLIYDFVCGIDEPDIAVCVPVEELQQRVLATLRSPAYVGLYTPEYNLFANPWVDRYDNCVTHTLKVFVASIYQTDDRARIYDNIRAYFVPTRIQLNLLQSIGVHREKAVRHDDAPPGGFQTATFESLRDFLAGSGLVRETFTLQVPATAGAATTPSGD